MVQRTILVVTLLLASGTYAAAQKCSDISTEWTLYSTFVDNTTATRIYGDGASYSSGTLGVGAFGHLRCDSQPDRETTADV